MVWNYESLLERGR